ncbi:hypothetical protein HK100_008806 [Physocladia obscura]|uniref:PH domain-containing protein n=1 Tax=Physocladia obscura TaxID=109957 RepID=A0AAD5XI97_9FUNG|nr:hypothetical protein HK100_008806 [Physocladia obscura]
MLQSIVENSDHGTKETRKQRSDNEDNDDDTSTLNSVQTTSTTAISSSSSSSLPPFSTAKVLPPRAAAALSVLHLSPSLPSGDLVSPRLWVYANGPDARSPQLSAKISNTQSIAVGNGGSVERARELAVFKRAATEVKILARDASMWAIPEHLAALGGSSSDSTSIASFSSRISANMPLGINSFSTASRGVTKQRKPAVDGPPPLPLRKDSILVPQKSSKEITYLPPSIPRIFVQLTDLRVKTTTQAPTPSIRGKTQHRRRPSNDSVAQSILSIKSAFGTFKQGLLRGMRVGDGDDLQQPQQPLRTRMTLNIGNSFRSKNNAAAVLANNDSNSGRNSAISPTVKVSIEKTASVAFAAATTAEPLYTIPCYYGVTVTSRSESFHNLFQFTRGGGDDYDDGASVSSLAAAEGLPESLIGQTVLVAQTQWDMKRTFEKIVFAPEDSSDSVLFGLAGLKLGGSGCGGSGGGRGDREVAVVTVQVGVFLDEVFPLVVEIPTVEYSTFLNFQISNGHARIWKKYWAVVNKGNLEIYDFEYKETKPMVSSLPLQFHIANISKPDPDEMCAMNCLQINFVLPFADQDEITPSMSRWRQSAIEDGGVVYVTADSKEGMVNFENQNGDQFSSLGSKRSLLNFLMKELLVGEICFEINDQFNRHNDRRNCTTPKLSHVVIHSRLRKQLSNTKDEANGDSETNLGAESKALIFALLMPDKKKG